MFFMNVRDLPTFITSAPLSFLCTMSVMFTCVAQLSQLQSVELHRRLHVHWKVVNLRVLSGVHLLFGLPFGGQLRNARRRNSY